MANPGDVYILSGISPIFCFLYYLEYFAKYATTLVQNVTSPRILKYKETLMKTVMVWYLIVMDNMHHCNHSHGWVARLRMM